MLVGFQESKAKIRTKCVEIMGEIHKFVNFYKANLKLEHIRMGDCDIGLTSLIMWISGVLLT